MKPFRMAADGLEAHRLETAVLLSSRTLARTVSLEREEVGPVTAFGIARGDGAERTARNRGADVFVVPMLDLGDGMAAWLGYREEWSSEAAGKSRNFSFRSSGVTIHFGYSGVEPKPQMFRAEWAGLVLVDKGYGYQAGDAGHPHWQFDAMESLAAAEAGDDAAMYAEMIRAERVEPELRDFALPAAAIPEVKAIASTRSVAAIHFASAAAWWRPTPDDAHAHHPGNVQQVRRWLSRTLDYLSAELRRV